MPTDLYAPLQKRRRPAGTIVPSGAKAGGRTSAVRTVRPWLEQMRHPFATPFRLVRQDSRRFIVAAEPNWSLVALAVVFLVGAYVIGGWALINGAVLYRPVDSFLIGITVIVMLHVAVRYLLGPLGGEQTYEFDKQTGLLSVTTKKLVGNQVDRYKLRDIVKLHVNRVDDGIYDPGTMLVIFQGGGTLQFPAHRGVTPRIEALVDNLGRFLEVSRSDVPPRPRDPEPPPLPPLDLGELALDAWLAQHR